MSPQPVSLARQVVIVTGASAGIGEATARAFAAQGACVVLAARRAERLERLAAEIEAQGGVALAQPTDVTDPAQVARLVAVTLAAFGRIDVLANIAGWGRYDWFDELSAADLRQQYEVNVLGLAELIRQVLPTLLAQRSGVILNMSSYASRIAVPPMTVYASTKYAVEGLSDGLRRELAPWGIDVVRVHPSGVRGTEFNRRAAQQGGLQFHTPALGKVSRERVARELVRLARRPRRALFLSRWYDVPAAINRLLPGVVDAAVGVWVRRQRPSLAAPSAAPAARRAGLVALVGGVLVGAVALAWAARPRA